MNADRQIEVFGPPREVGTKISLPMGVNLLGPEGSCEMLINSAGVQDMASWFEIWEGVQVLNAM